MLACLGVWRCGVSENSVVRKYEGEAVKVGQENFCTVEMPRLLQ